LLVIAYCNEQVPLVLDRTTADGWRSDALEGGWTLATLNFYGLGLGAAALTPWPPCSWSRDVSRVDPGAAPMRTRYWETLVSDGRSSAEELLIDMIENRVSEFARGVVGAPLSALCDRIRAGGDTRIPKPALLHALSECGWLDRGVVSSREHPTKNRPTARQRWPVSATQKSVGCLSPTPRRRACAR
jgi:hypothetical protein